MLLIVYNQLIRRAERFVTVTGKGYRPTRYALGQWRTPALLFVGFYLAVAAILPAIVLVWTSFVRRSSADGMSLDAYRHPARRPAFLAGGAQHLPGRRPAAPASSR